MSQEKFSFMYSYIFFLSRYYYSRYCTILDQDERLTCNHAVCTISDFPSKPFLYSMPTAYCLLPNGQTMSESSPILAVE